MSSRLSPGGHRLLCGDATSEDDHRRVIGGAKIDAVITDPPYGVGIEYRSFNAVGRVLGGFSALRTAGIRAVEAAAHLVQRGDRDNLFGISARCPDWAWVHRELRRSNVTLAPHRRREASA